MTPQQAWKQIISDRHHLCHLPIKKLELVILIPPKLDRVISQDFVHSAATNLYVAYIWHVLANHQRYAMESIVCCKESSVHPFLWI